MKISTDTVTLIDLNNPEILSIINQYESVQFDPDWGTDKIEVPLIVEDNKSFILNGTIQDRLKYTLPPNKEVFSVQAWLGRKMLSQPCSTSPITFLINRISAILANETSQIIETDLIEKWSRYLKNKDSDYFTIDIKLAHDEKDFCKRHGVLQYIPVSAGIIKRSFSNIQDFYTELLQDPETDEQWLVINIEVAGEIEDILDMYDKYTGEWVSSVPWPERERIVLTYTII